MDIVRCLDKLFFLLPTVTQTDTFKKTITGLLLHSKKYKRLLWLSDIIICPQYLQLNWIAVSFRTLQHHNIHSADNHLNDGPLCPDEQGDCI